MQRPLKDGLVLRSLNADDGHTRSKFLDFYGLEGSEEQGSRDWADDLSDPERPTIKADDSWVVVDTNRDDLGVAALCLIPQRWRYDGLDLQVGRIEHVATHPEYRRRGLMSALMQAAHERSQEQGHCLQAITGRADLYRRYGYTQAVPKWPRASIPFAAIPPLPDGQEPLYTLRTATDKDVPKLLALEEQGAPQCTLTCARTADEWHYELNRKKTRHSRTELIVDRTGNAVGFLALTLGAGHCYKYVVGETTSYLQTIDDVLRGMKTAFKKWEKEENNPEPTQLTFYGGPPALERLLKTLSPPVAYEWFMCWYFRAANPARLFNLIAPALERRLALSDANRYSGQLKIDFYDTSGLELSFDEGRISARDVEISEEARFDVDAGFSHHALLNLVFGYNSLEELQKVLPDCSANRTATVLLEELFPVKGSHIWGIW